MTSLTNICVYWNEATLYQYAKKDGSFPPHTKEWPSPAFFYQNQPYWDKRAIEAMGD